MKNDPSRNWWWRKFANLDRAVARRDKFKNCEAAAFYYELARRNFALADYPMFTKLKRGEFDIVYLTFGRKFAGWKQPLAISYLDIMNLPKGFTSFPSVGWNLNES